MCLPLMTSPAIRRRHSSPMSLKSKFSPPIRSSAGRHHVHEWTDLDPSPDVGPALQAIGPDDPSGQKWLAGHLVGQATPTAQKDPAGHSTDLVTVGQYRPLAHASHETFPAHVTKVPGGQGIGAQRPGWSHL